MNILEELLKHSHGLHLLWCGNNGWLLWDGQTLIGCDLDLLNEERKNPSLIDTSLLKKHLQLLLITHEHEDHFNSPTIHILEHSDCHLIVPLSCQKKMIQFSIPHERIRYVKPHDHIQYHDIQIQCLRALHGHKEGTIYRHASLLDCGYIIKFAHYNIYQPGDTVILEEHLTLKDIDILFVSPTVHNTHIHNSKWLIEKLQPQYVLAQHFGTYRETPQNLFWTHGYVEELQLELSQIPVKYIIPQEKTIITFQNPSIIK